MKKLTRKLFISVMTLVLTAMALGTSTFAWFSMNTRVTGTGMEVTAKSNAVFLLIGNEDSAKNIQTAGSTTIAAHYATSGNSAKTVFPAAYYTSAGTLGTTSTVAGKWYTASNSNINNSVDSVTNVREVTEGAADYMLTYELYLTLSADSADLSRQIQVTPIINENTNVTVASGKNKITSPVSCLVVFGENPSNSTERLNFASSTTAQTTGSISLSANSCVKVTVYVYINGNDAEVKSQNLIDGHKLTGNLSLQFDLVTPQEP